MEQGFTIPGYYVGQKVIADTIARAAATVIGFVEQNGWLLVSVKFNEPIAVGTIHKTITGNYHPQAVWTNDNESEIHGVPGLEGLGT